VFLGCFRRFQLRARLGSPWLHQLSPLADPTVQIYRSGFLKRDSPHHSKNAGYVVATMGVSVGWLHISPRSSRFHEYVG
jgi:hypothetical protein